MLLEKGDWCLFIVVDNVDNYIMVIGKIILCV